MHTLLEIKGRFKNVRIGAFYPNGVVKMFDMKYYCENVVPLLKEWFGDALKGVVVDRGYYGGIPDEKPRLLVKSSSVVHHKGS